MPTFEFKSPEGKTYEITGPDGATPEQAFSILKQYHPDLGGEQTSGGKSTDIVPDEKDPALGIHFGGSHLTSSTIAEGPTWEQAQQRLVALQNAGVSEDDPRFKQAMKDKALGLQRLTGSAAEGFATLGGISAGGAAAGKVIPFAAGKFSDIAGAVTGATAKTAQEGVRDVALDEARAVAASRGQEATQYRARLDAITKAQKQLESQPATAESRAYNQALRHAPFSEEQGRVLADIRSRVNALEQEHKEAGATTEVARMLAQQSEQRIIDAENGVAELEKEFLARPGASADEFGGKLRDLTQKLSGKYEKIRAEQSGYNKAIESAGNYQRIDTRPMIQKIDDELRGIRNPSLQSTLTHVKELLESEGRPALTLRSADSLRKYLDSIIQSRSVNTATGPMAVDRETVHFISAMKKDLVKAATESWQPYREALGKWRTLSRPLDIVERKGALRRVIDTDPVSTDYVMAKAQVVGEVLRQAKAGNPVFTRLIQESPDLRESARLYFTQDLFGKETVPSEASLRNWLKSNEGSLRQLGLYDEFKDIKAAKQTAQRAVDSAKQARDLSKEELKKSIEEENKIGQQIKDQASLREKEKARMAAAQKSLTTPQEIMSQSEKRAAQAERRLGQQERQTRGALGDAEKVADRYKQFQSEIEVARPREVPVAARKLVDQLLADKVIDASKHASIVKQIQVAEDTAKDAADLRKRVLFAIGGVAALGGVGGAVSHIKNAVGM